jgi:hypothetical protein
MDARTGDALCDAARRSLTRTRRMSSLSQRQTWQISPCLAEDIHIEEGSSSGAGRCAAKGTGCVTSVSISEELTPVEHSFGQAGC